METRESVGPSEPLFEGTLLKGPSTSPFLVRPRWPQPQSSRPRSFGPSPCCRGCSVNYRVLCPRGTAMVHCSSLVPGDCTSYPKSGHISPTLSPPVRAPTHQGSFSSLLTGLSSQSVHVNLSIPKLGHPSSAPHPPMAPTYQANKALPTCPTPFGLPE